MATNGEIVVAVLAAGKGTRMRSTLPKVLHKLAGRSLVERVLDGLQGLSVARRLLIVGYGAEQVRQALVAEPGLEFVEQTEQKGTGHAIQQLLPHLEGFSGDLLVLNGDVPLLRPESLRTLLETHRASSATATLLTAHLPNAEGYGRVFCDGQNSVREIVEDRDCTAAQKQNRRVNAGVYCFSWPDLARVLPSLSTNNDQQEYYLTEVMNYLEPVVAVDIADPQEILGINDREQLAMAYQILQDRVKRHWMQAGVTFIDPDSSTIDDTVELAPDVVIEPQTHLRGKTCIGANCRIGPGSLVEDAQIGANTAVLYSVVRQAQLGADSQVGPFAHLRGNVVTGSHCRLGNFVELKNTTLGDHTNAAHLSYLGDATLGSRVNVGAGTITANYDGVRKHPTVVGDGSKLGSNTVLVAPLTLGESVTVAAGSVVTEDVADDALVVARSRQVVKPGWRPKSSPPPETP
ncbi:bifunctional UDP-N-acetylglucosamine diphosphorylase/glucosamine-1-phosphate N-acetyltransferase GlmU [Leptolyngbya sp. FACHB-261]|uniref:bifunctional UDP-N-acetylglucosamine diphosphorylase/glucosamine-1-phosphate N-acetyltransferase GlmU n=1 Tax=Leptolyngbya sp. FACHB-261 TaxID=2692806 RepID=UPI001688AAEF|nr:bifunctional UDP-N-acetylglucosamine diphosphorylase/glucosamine-1-phosphate N-acetyltransferase GlmU [Leptolyngbya sp. FACHB-261]MBD2104270.1 bifunctional UDP-N-acetylglucosamine diphosphorylase/glucosamine-1-phosphate N-acetyltransferase GlmU [Leptolyngbya sp. FACHB-261]